MCKRQTLDPLSVVVIVLSVMAIYFLLLFGKKIIIKEGTIMAAYEVSLQRQILKDFSTTLSDC